MRLKPTLLFACAATALAPASAQSQIADLSGQINSGTGSSEKIVKFLLKRIARLDQSGPRVNAIIALNPNALADARALDAERKAGRVRGLLHGMPILIKDNIETADAMPTTGGSLALQANITRRDAPIVARLRAAGAIILGKTNLSEWANFRSVKSTSGWSAVGGLTRNPHRLDYNPCGSSSGSGAAMAARFAVAALGTETDGSIVCPAAANGVVGFKSTVGLLSRTHIIPISASQDTPGPMTLTVRDAAILLTVMAGSDPADPATREADARRTNYAEQLSPSALSGVRLGLIRAPGDDGPLMDGAIKRLRQAGAIIVLVPYDTASFGAISDAEFKVLRAEFKHGLGVYLRGLPPGLVPHRSLADLIAFNSAHAGTELAHFGQDIFEASEAEAGPGDPAYLEARALSLRLAGADGIDRILRDHGVDLIVAQTNGPAWVTTLGAGDTFIPPSASQMPAVAGYPHLTVPMGLTKDGLPVGLSFIGPKWADAAVLRAGYAFEQAGPSLLPTPRFRRAAKPVKPRP